jgi:transposase
LERLVYTVCDPWPFLNAIMNECPVGNVRAWVGLDWGCHQHCFALQIGSHPPKEGTIEASPNAFHEFLERLEKRAGGMVALAVEGSHRPVIDALEAYPWVVVYAINPSASAYYRRTFFPSGAKDDLPDARLLLELARDHAGKLRPWQRPDEPTELLEDLTRARRGLVDQRVQLTQKMRALLRGYFPQALELAGDLKSEMALEFLGRWPDLTSLKMARPSTIRNFYFRNHVRRPQLVEKRLELIAQARPLRAHDARALAGTLALGALIAQVRALNKHIKGFDREIKKAFAEHAEAALFRDLPGAGPQMAARLCAAFGSDRTVYPAAANLQKRAGIAPVIEKSGKQRWTHWRWLAPKFLRQTFVEWAGLTVMHSAWARSFYHAKLKEGKEHTEILRALAFKWIRVIWKCWQTQTPYNEARYLKQLRRRGSPYAASAHT